MPPVLVTAARTPESIYRTPFDFGGARDVLNPTELAEISVLNTQELLRRTPSVFFFEETGTDSKPNIAVRGVTSGSEGSGRSANVSLLVDGIPLAPAPYGHAGQSLFPFTLERVHAVDILRGGFTVRYGPNTVSGIINYLTRPIPDARFVEQRLRANSYGDYSSYTAFGGTFGPLGVLGEAVYKWGDTYREHGDFTLQNYALKTSYEISPDVRALFQFEYFDDESDLADGLSLAAFQQDPKQSLSLQNRFEGDQTRGNLQVDWDIDENTRFEIVGYVFGGERTFYLGQPRYYGSVANYIDATPRPMNVWAIEPRLFVDYEFDGGSGELACGLRYHYEDITRKSERIFPDGSVTVRSNNTYDYTAWSAFVENTFHFGDFSLTPGIRFEAVDMDGHNELNGLSVSRSFTEILPALSAAYAVEADWSIYANIQSSFLPPQSNHIEISANPQNLEAQYAWTYEIGTRNRFADGVLLTDLTLYWIDYEDRIERDPDQFNVFVNRGNTRHLGAEFTLDADFGRIAACWDGLRAFVTASYNDSEYSSGEFDGNQVPHAPHGLASWGLVYRHYDTGLWAGFDGAYVGSAYSDSENTEAINADGTRGKRPDYTIWNLNVGFDHEIAENAELKLRAGLANVFDEEYFEIRAGRGLFLGRPRGWDVMLGVSLKF